jgi:glycosyltransferase involved in cell wall biosynthesis
VSTYPQEAPRPLRVLALEAYYGGSHKAFLDGWIADSRHDWTLLTLPDSKWKWRMRHAGVTFAEQVNAAVEKGAQWDAIFTSDMLSLADFRGLAPKAVRDLPAVAYFHENQLTYPVHEPSERDYHFVFSNITTALSAEAVWFNSAFHRDEFLGAATEFVRRMPDFKILSAIETIRAKAVVHSPSIEMPAAPTPRREGPLHILWAARWERDKCPERFFKAVDLLVAQDVDFELSVVGGEVGRQPLPIFKWARQHFADHIRQWGFLESRAAYAQLLTQADVVVSTADHEFFGISILEAAARGAFPLLPRRLAYPEVFAGGDETGYDSFFYDGSEASLAQRLAALAGRKQKGDLWQGRPHRAYDVARRFASAIQIPLRDAALSALL